jgi:hypothetical protein
MTGLGNAGRWVTALVALSAHGAFAACPGLSLGTTCDASTYNPSSPASVTIKDVNLQGLTSRWVSNGLGRYVKPNGYKDRFVIPQYRTAEVEVIGFGACADVIAVQKLAASWCGAASGGTSYDCLMLGTQREYDWGVTAPGFYNIHGTPSPIPAPVDPPNYGRCLVDSPPAGSTSDYQLNDFGLMIVTLLEPSTRQFSVTIGDLDGLATGGGAREAAAVFGLDRNGALVRPTIVAGARVTLKKADINAADGQAIGLDVSGGVQQIDLAEADNTGGAAPTGAEAQVKYSFAKAVSKICFLFVWAQSPNDVSRTTAIETGYAIFFDSKRVPTVGCAVPCKKSYAPSDSSSGACDPGSNFFDITYDAASTKYCQEMDYCDLCDNTNKKKLSNSVRAGHFYGGTGPPDRPV